MSLPEAEFVEAFRARGKFAPLLLRLGARQSEVDDFLADTFASIWEQRDSYEERGSLDGYIVTRLRCRLIDDRRAARHRCGPITDQTPVATESSAEEVALAEAERERIHEMFADAAVRLPGIQGPMFIDYYFKELSIEELVRSYGRSTEAVKQALQRARNGVKKRLGVT